MKKKPVKPEKIIPKAPSKPNGTRKGAKVVPRPVGKTLRHGSLVARILEVCCDHTEKKPITRGELFDLLCEEFVPPRKESDVTMWLSYCIGYCHQAGHTVHKRGRGPTAVFWAEMNTQAPNGRRFGGKEKECY